MNLQRKLKVGLDIHGVIDAHPVFFSKLTQSLIEKGHQVYIITGARITDDLIWKLTELGIVWSSLYSITDYNINRGERVHFADPSNPWMDSTTWDSTKAKICYDLKVDIHVDDTLRYGEWFEKLKVPTLFVYANKFSLEQLHSLFDFYTL